MSVDIDIIEVMMNDHSRYEYLIKAYKCSNMSAIDLNKKQLYSTVCNSFNHEDTL